MQSTKHTIFFWVVKIRKFVCYCFLSLFYLYNSWSSKRFTRVPCKLFLFQCMFYHSDVENFSSELQVIPSAKQKMHCQMTWSSTLDVIYNFIRSSKELRDFFQQICWIWLVLQLCRKRFWSSLTSCTQYFCVFPCYEDDRCKILWIYPWYRATNRQKKIKDSKNWCNISSNKHRFFQ